MTTWMEETEAKIEAVAVEHGWNMVLRDIAGTGSRYYELMRECRAEDDTEESIADFGLTGLESITLRISDHGDAYCRSDYSLAERPSGDDTTIEAVIRRLSSRATMLAFQKKADLKEQIADLTRQRDALLEACKMGLERVAAEEKRTESDYCRQMRVFIEAAIADVEDKP